MNETSCTIKLAISYTLKNFIEKLINNINQFEELLNSEDILLYNKLDQLIDNKSRGYICENRCMGCLDYVLVNRIFSNFYTNIEKTNNSSKLLLEHICKTLELKELDHPIIIAINLISNPKYIEKKINEDKKNEYNEYLLEINNHISSLKKDFYNQKITELTDIIFHYDFLIKEQEINQKKIELKKDLTFYIDQNFIGNYINNSSLRKQINNAKIKNSYQFIFSPYLVEDGIKMNKVFLKEYFEQITKLTDGILITRYDNELCPVKEEITTIVKRVLLWIQPTKAAESLKFYTYLYNQNAYPMFKRDSKSSYYQEINKDIKSFFKNINLKPEMKDLKKTLNSYITMLKSYPFDLEMLEKGNIKVDNDFDCIEKIDKLCEFLDFINYETDKEIQKIKSSYQDTEHLKHAWKCKYFITNDEKLIKRGKFVYSILGINTIFLTNVEFKKMMIEQLKNNDKNL